MDSNTDNGSLGEAEVEVATLEVQLAAAKKKLELQKRKPSESGGNAISGHAAQSEQSAQGAPGQKVTLGPEPLRQWGHRVLTAHKVSLPPATHYLLLLADSALPLGSFAFSSGLESYLAHTPRGRASFASFLPESVSSYASTTLPFVLAAWRDPESLPTLDDTLDAAIICAVGRRASVAQGRALMSIWERSFAGSGSMSAEAVETLRPYAEVLRASAAAASSAAAAAAAAAAASTPSTASSISGSCRDAATPPPVHAHLGPLFGAVCKLVGLTLQQTAYVFMLSHVKALVSAAVRASVFGPYQAQKVLAGNTVQDVITAAIEREWDTPYEEAGQTMPVMDLWIGRHEVLYSRIFNS